MDEIRMHRYLYICTSCSRVLLTRCHNSLDTGALDAKVVRDFNMLQSPGKRKIRGGYTDRSRIIYYTIFRYGNSSSRNVIETNKMHYNYYVRV